jgi:hypothetical protein
MGVPRGYLGGSKKEDVNDAVLNSEYDEKRKKYEEREMLTEKTIELRDLILEVDPKLEYYLDPFRICQDLLKKIGVNK